MQKEQKISYGLYLVIAATDIVLGVVSIFSGVKVIYTLFYFGMALLLLVLLYFLKKSDDNINDIIAEIINSELENNTDSVVGTYRDLKLETMIIPINSTIVLWYNHSLSFDEVKSVFTDVTTAFPNNVVVALPDKTSIQSCSLDELNNVLKVVEEAVDYAVASKSKPVDLEKEVVVE